MPSDKLTELKIKMSKSGIKQKSFIRWTRTLSAPSA